jgi:hypothetical protein
MNQDKVMSTGRGSQMKNIGSEHDVPAKPMKNMGNMGRQQSGKMMSGEHSHQMMNGEHSTGTKDEHYDLVSVLYHALQGAETCMKYLHDAQQAGDQELVQLFRETQECNRHLADRAKSLLTQRLGQGHAMSGAAFQKGQNNRAR